MTDTYPHVLGAAISLVSVTLPPYLDRSGLSDAAARCRSVTTASDKVVAVGAAFGAREAVAVLRARRGDAHHAGRGADLLEAVVAVWLAVDAAYYAVQCSHASPGNPHTSADHAAWVLAEVDAATARLTRLPQDTDASLLEPRR